MRREGAHIDTPQQRAIARLCATHHIECVVDPTALVRCSRDQSIFSRMPTAIVRITNADQLQPIISYARDARIPITPRGGGSGTGGAGITEGIVIDLSAMNSIADPRPISQCIPDRAAPPPATATHCVAVGAGATVSRIARHLRRHGLWLPIDMTSAPIAHIGGAIATNAGAPQSMRFGALQAWVAALNATDGTGARARYADRLFTDSPAHTDETSAGARADQPAGSHTGNRTDYPVDHLAGDRVDNSIDDRIAELRAIQRTIARMPRVRAQCHRSAQYKQLPGYNIAALIQSKANNATIYSRLLCGSMGTFACIDAAILYCRPLPATHSALYVELTSLHALLHTYMNIHAYCVAHPPIIAVELLPISDPRANAALHIDIIDDPGNTCLHALHARIARVARRSLSSIAAITNHRTRSRYWRIRSQALARARIGDTSHPIINDITIPIAALRRTLPLLIAHLNRASMPYIVYGHIADGNLHFRPHIPDRLRTNPTALGALIDAFYAIVHRARRICRRRAWHWITTQPISPRNMGRRCLRCHAAHPPPV